MRWNWKKGIWSLLSLGVLAYGGLLAYAWQQFGAGPAEVNDYLAYWTVGKGRLKPKVAPPPAATRGERWAQDVDYLAAELPRLHANAFHSVSEREWLRRVQELRNRIPSQTDSQLTVGILELVALIGDGHTSVHDWTYDWKLPAAPVSLSWYGEKLYVTWARGEGVPLLGAELVGIGGVPAQQAVQRAYRVTSGDSDWDKSARAKELLRYEAVQHFLGLQANTFRFRLPSGEQRTKTFTPVTEQKNTTWQPLPLPLLRKKHVNLPFWFEQLNDHTIYLRYLVCTDATGFRTMTAQIVPLLRVMPRETRTLILDVRGNGGGNSSVIAPLQSRLKSLGFGRGGGRVAVLTDRLTYSSAFNNTQIFRKVLGARLYGEAPGENLATYGEVRTITLPNSKLEVQISGRKFPNRTLPELGGGLLQPDVKVQNTLPEEIQGQDRVLQAALRGL